MGYQKLQAGRYLDVIPSDTVNIPNLAAVAQSGTTTSGTTSKLTDTGGDFINKNVKIGDIIYAGAVAATVTAIDSATVLSTSATIPTATAYTIYSQADNPQNGCALYCGGTGDITVVNTAGDVVTFKAIPTGLFLPLNSVIRVNSTNTDATFIIALW